MKHVEGKSLEEPEYISYHILLHVYNWPLFFEVIKFLSKTYLRTFPTVVENILQKRLLVNYLHFPPEYDRNKLAADTD